MAAPLQPPGRNRRPTPARAALEGRARARGAHASPRRRGSGETGCPSQAEATPPSEDDEPRRRRVDGVAPTSRDGQRTRLDRELERTLLRTRNGIRLVAGSSGPKLGATPKDVVWQRGRAELWRYHGGEVRYA